MTDMVDFTLTTRPGDDGSSVVELAGELDLYPAPELTDALQGGSGPVVVDLQEVTFLDSTTLALLVREHRRLRTAGRDLTVLVGPRTPTSAFAITGVDGILAVRSAAAPSATAGALAA